jgi:hypothetical protein
MYRTLPPKPHTSETALKAYAVFLRDLPRFEAALQRVLREWPRSCEQFLTNEHINRIAWLGQASMCIDTRVPAKFRAGFQRLTAEEQRLANAMADTYLQKWLAQHNTELDFQWDYGDGTRPAKGLHAKIGWYMQHWGYRGYRHGLPEEVAKELSDKQLAPSYRAIACAILENDVALEGLGFIGKHSDYYDMLKRIELSERGALCRG